MKIFGFGSFFKECNKFHDIDILIVHPNNEFNSCKFAIECKRILLSGISHLDVSILSKSEEHEKEFIKQSSAMFLRKICENTIEKDLQEFIIKLSLDVRRKHETRTVIKQNITKFSS